MHLCLDNFQRILYNFNSVLVNSTLKMIRYVNFKFKCHQTVDIRWKFEMSSKFRVLHWFDPNSYTRTIFFNGISCLWGLKCLYWLQLIFECQLYICLSLMFRLRHMLWFDSNALILDIFFSRFMSNLNISFEIAIILRQFMNLVS